MRWALAFRGFPANVVPSTIVLDSEGRVAAVYTGAVARDDLQAALTPAGRPASAPRSPLSTHFAYTEASAARGALLGLAYRLGLGVPFVAMALGARRALGMSAWARRHARTVMRIGGGLLIVIGLLLLTGLWDQLMFWFRAWIAATGLGDFFL